MLVFWTTTYAQVWVRGVCCCWGHDDLTGLINHKEPRYHLGQATTEDYVWVHDPNSAMVCVDVHGFYYNQRQYRYLGSGLPPGAILESSDHAAACALPSMDLYCHLSPWWHSVPGYHWCPCLSSCSCCSWCLCWCLLSVLQQGPSQTMHWNMIGPAELALTVIWEMITPNTNPGITHPMTTVERAEPAPQRRVLPLSFLHLEGPALILTIALR